MHRTIDWILSVFTMGYLLIGFGVTGLKPETETSRLALLPAGFSMKATKFSISTHQQRLDTARCGSWSSDSGCDLFVDCNTTALKETRAHRLRRNEVVQGEAQTSHPSHDALSPVARILDHHLVPGLVQDELATDLTFSQMDWDVDFDGMALDGAVVSQTGLTKPGVAPNVLSLTTRTNNRMPPKPMVAKYQISKRFYQTIWEQHLVEANIEAVFISPRFGMVSEDVTWSVRLTNHSQQNRKIKIDQAIRNTINRGDLLEFLAKQTLVETLAPGESRLIALAVTEKDYLKAIKNTNYLYGFTLVESLETKETGFSDSRVSMGGPGPTFSKRPKPSILKIGDTLEFEVQFTNPFSFPVKGVRLEVSSYHLVFGPNLEKSMVQKTEQILPGKTFVFSGIAQGLSAGKGQLSATIDYLDMYPIGNNSSTPIEVYADCNANGVPDDQDIEQGISQDCNENDIPDACELASGSRTDVNGNGLLDTCEPDCNRNRIPDSWELLQGLVEDCNGNGIPDSCDITGILARPFSSDANFNRIPDECEPDCNGNGIPDTVEITQGKAADSNGNGIPDECDSEPQQSGKAGSLPHGFKPPKMVQPTLGSQLRAAEATFQWDGGNATPEDFRLEVGSQAGGSDYFSGLPLGRVQTQTVSNLPVDGRLIFLRLHYRLGDSLHHLDSSYTAVRLPQMTAPNPSTPLDGPDQVFVWRGNGLAVEEWQLMVGTAQGQSDLFRSGPLPANATDEKVTGLPLDGSNLFARLRYRIGGDWSHRDSLYTAFHLPGEPTFIDPAPGSVLPGFAALFSYSKEAGMVDHWQVFAGSTRGDSDYFKSGILIGQTTTAHLSNLPTDGSTVWVRLRYRIGSTWFERDFSYTASSVEGGPSFTDPAPGTTLPGFATTFNYTNDGGDINAWQIYAGSEKGASDYFHSDIVNGGVFTSKVSNLPTDGSPVWVRLRYRIGPNWHERDFQFIASRAPGGPTFVDPAPGSTLQGFATQFTYTNDGGDIDNWQIYAGSTRGAKEYFRSGQQDGKTLTTQVTNLPTDGSQVWMQLRYRIGPTWYERDFPYTASNMPGGPAFVDPAPGSTLSGFATQFTYSNDGLEFDHWQIYAGSTQGANDYFQSNVVDGKTLRANVSNLPTDGSPVWMRLRYQINSVWYWRDYQYTASSVPAGPTILDPVPGSELGGFATAFTYTNDGGDIDQWTLSAGSRKGLSEYFRTDALDGQTFSANIHNLPTDGRQVWVKLSYRIGGIWHSRDFQYTASNVPGGPTFTDPKPGSVLPGFETTFTYSADGGYFDECEILVGSKQGASDYYHSYFSDRHSFSTKVRNLPTDGSTVWVRLRYLINLRLYERDFQYTASSVPGGPTITAPAPGDPLPGFATTFTYTNDSSEVVKWQIYAGSARGLFDYYRSDHLDGKVLSTLVGNLPTDGSTVWVQLRFRINNSWITRDFQYTASNVPGGPTFTDPKPGSVLPGFETTFTFTKDGGDIDGWEISAGSKKGASDYFSSTSLDSNTLSTIVSNLPTDGSIVWIQLAYWFRSRFGSYGEKRDFQYTAASVPDGPTITDPAPGSTLPGFATRFAYSYDGSAISRWQIYAGSSQGSQDYYHSDEMSGSTRSIPIFNLPGDGSPVWVRLRYQINNTWYQRDFLYTASSVPGGPTIIEPKPGSILSGSAVQFHYTNDDSDVNSWEILVGSTQGASDYFRAENLYGTTLGIKIHNLPTDGSMIWVRLRFCFNYRIWPKWYERDFQYTASSVPGGPTFTAPVPGSTLPGFTTLFSFTGDGADINAWQIHAGSKKGASDYFDSGTLIGNKQSTKISNLPTDGSTVWMKLRYQIKLAWYERNFEYTASSVPGGPTFTDPLPESTLPGFQALFTFTNDGCDISRWQIYAGTARGNLDYFDSDLLSGTTRMVNVSHLPADGSTVWMQLRYFTNNQWYERVFPYTASGSPNGPTIIDPPPGSQLPGRTATFSFTADRDDIELWTLLADTKLGGSGYGYATGTATTVTLTDLPTNGRNLFLRLRYRIKGTWYWRDFTYVAAAAKPK